MFRAVLGSPVNLLLVAAPISWLLEVQTPGSAWVFVTAAASLIPFAGLIGLATEDLARRSGPAWGGFLNATFGNAAEIGRASCRERVESSVGVVSIKKKMKTAKMSEKRTAHVAHSTSLNVTDSTKGTRRAA